FFGDRLLDAIEGFPDFAGGPKIQDYPSDIRFVSDRLRVELEHNWEADAFGEFGGFRGGSGGSGFHGGNAVALEHVVRLHFGENGAAIRARLVDDGGS